MTTIKRNNPKKDGDNVYRFYKSKLPTVVWDPIHNRPLAEFTKGQYQTKKKKVARILIDLGYPQVDPTAMAPPDVVVELPGQSIDTEGESTTNAKMTGENQASKPITPVVRQ